MFRGLFTNVFRGKERRVLEPRRVTPFQLQGSPAELARADTLVQYMPTQPRLLASNLEKHGERVHCRILLTQYTRSV